MIVRIYLGILHQCGLGSIILWKDERASVARGAISHCQSAAYRAKFTGRGKLPCIFCKFVGRDLPGGCKYAECDRKIEPPAFLGKIRWCEIDCDAARGKIKPAVLQRGAHAVLAFFDFGFRQADDSEVGQSVGEMNFNSDESGFHA